MLLLSILILVVICFCYREYSWRVSYDSNAIEDITVISKTLELNEDISLNLSKILFNDLVCANLHDRTSMSNKKNISIIRDLDVNELFENCNLYNQTTSFEKYSENCASNIISETIGDMELSRIVASILCMCKDDIKSPLMKLSYFFESSIEAENSNAIISVLNDISSNHQQSVLLNKRGSNKKLYTRFSIVQILIYIFILLFEVHSIHRILFDDIDSDDKLIPPDISFKLKVYIGHRFPVISIIFNSTIFLIAFISWLGLGLDRTNISRFLVKLILLWSTSLMITPIINNLYRISFYFPTTFSDWIKRCSEFQFWYWFISKTICQNDLFQFFQLFCCCCISIAYSWPYRYLFYYDEIVYENGNSLDVFVLNMIMHSSLAWIWVNILFIYLIGSPICLRKISILKSIGADSTVAVFTAVLILSLVIFLIRLLWFIFITQGCKTWYSCWITVSFVFVYLGIFVNGALLLSAFMRRSDFIKNNQSEFIKHFSEKLLGEKTTDTLNENINSIEDFDPSIASLEIFTFAVDRSMLVLLFDTKDHDKNHSNPDSNAEEPTEEDVIKSLFEEIIYRISRRSES